VRIRYHKQEAVDFLLNRVAPGEELVVGAANDNRSSIGGNLAVPPSDERSLPRQLIESFVAADPRGTRSFSRTCSSASHSVRRLQADTPANLAEHQFGFSKSAGSVGGSWVFRRARVSKSPGILRQLVRIREHGLQ
jgi:hypothetical protein